MATISRKTNGPAAFIDFKYQYVLIVSVLYVNQYR